MERVFKGMTIFIIGAALLFSGAVYSAADEKPSERIVARVGKLKLPLSELRAFARNRPELTTYLSIPGGGKKLVDIWVQERLVALHALQEEGKDPYEAITQLSQDQIAELFGKTLQKELPPLEPVTAEDAKAAYENHPRDYTVPARVQLKQMLFALDGKADAKSAAQTRRVLEQAQADIEKGGDFDAVYAEAHKKIPALTEHDFGFIPLDGSYQGEEAVKDLEPGKARVYETKDAIMLFYAVAKRPAILEPYERIESVIINDLQKKRAEARWNQYIGALKKDFAVEILL